MRVLLNACYFLHLRPYRETSLIAEVLSREHGRIALVARGARRPTNRAMSLYQPMRPLQIAWTARGELGTLSAIEPGGPPWPLHGSRLVAGFYVNELLVRLLHRHESHPELFHAYERALEGLARRQPEEPTLRIFEKHLLLSLGYGLILDRDVRTGRAIEPYASYRYVPARGPSTDANQQDPGIVISGAALIALREETLCDPELANECKRLMRMLLAEHLGSRPLASRDLYRQLLANRTPGCG